MLAGCEVFCTLPPGPCPCTHKVAAPGNLPQGLRESITSAASSLPSSPTPRTAATSRAATPTPQGRGGGGGDDGDASFPATSDDGADLASLLDDLVAECSALQREMMHLRAAALPAGQQEEEERDAAGGPAGAGGGEGPQGPSGTSHANPLFDDGPSPRPPGGDVAPPPPPPGADLAGELQRLAGCAGEVQRLAASGGAPPPPELAAALRQLQLSCGRLMDVAGAQQGVQAGLERALAEVQQRALQREAEAVALQRQVSQSEGRLESAESAALTLEVRGRRGARAPAGRWGRGPSYTCRCRAVVGTIAGRQGHAMPLTPCQPPPPPPPLQVRLSQAEEDMIGMQLTVCESQQHVLALQTKLSDAILLAVPTPETAALQLHGGDTHAPGHLLALAAELAGQEYSPGEAGRQLPAWLQGLAGGGATDGAPGLEPAAAAAAVGLGSLRRRGSALTSGGGSSTSGSRRVTAAMQPEEGLQLLQVGV